MIIHIKFDPYNIFVYLDVFNNMDPTSMIGCEHYERSIQIYASCCNKWFSCHVCHNSESNHEIDRKQIHNIKCLTCNMEQKSSEYCINDICKLNEDINPKSSGQIPKKKLCHYVCTLCGLYSNDISKDIYHCDGCGICRVGPKENYYHCLLCKLCYPLAAKDIHKCTINRLDQKCAICQNGLFDIRDNIIPFDKCQHAMCAICYKEYIKTNYRCPICRKSICDMSLRWIMIDNDLDNQILPLPYSEMTRDIICADCDKKSSSVPFDFQYHKCNHCGSYNTNIMEITDVNDSNQN